MDDKPEIGRVLKSLNHPLRREILIYLSERRTSKFTDLHNHVEGRTKSTGQFSYHLNLLVEAQVLLKNDDIYSLSPIGEKATSMIQLIDIEVDTTISQQISTAYDQLSPRELVITTWTVVPLIIFAVFMSGSIPIEFTPLERALINLTAALLFAASTAYAYSKLQYLPALLVLSNIIWIFFLPRNHLQVFLIYITAGVGTGVFLTGALVESNALLTILGFVLLVIGVFLSMRYVMNESRWKDIRIA
ncbi:MAG: DUF7347 domain-containing protein [Candidatus Kariarchaeaceae archaeon]